ncbi:MAG: amidohydrolase family protein [Gemmataceae bacterium]
MERSILTADRLFDGTGRATIAGPQLHITGQHIDTRETNLLAPPSCSAAVYAFPGCTILPGLIDTHVHLIFSAKQAHEAVVEQVTGESDAELAARAIQNAQAALRSGITTVRDCGGKGTVIQQVRDAIRNEDIPGPDVISCGVPITTTTGHCHWLGLTATTPQEVTRAVEQMLAEDADWLKVMATGGNMTPSPDAMQAQYPNEVLALIADMGREASKHSAAHVLSRSAMAGVVRANYRTIEHCDWRVDEIHYEFEPELAVRMLDQNQFVGLTMSGTTRRALFPEIASLQSPKLTRRLNNRFVCERQIIDFGLKYTLHSDAGVGRTPIDTFADGLQAAKIELRLTPAEILLAVTRTAAEALDLFDRGTLTAGKLADLVVVDGNPLQDLTALANIRAVMKAGKWVAGDIPEKRETPKPELF